MEHGDLETFSRSRVLLVLEAVLATVTPILEPRRLRKAQITGHTIQWHDTALKRLITNTVRYPQVGFTVITFVSEQVRDDAADVLATIPVDVEAVEFYELSHFQNMLRFQTDVMQVLDADQRRLDGYGQRGRSVIPGSDWG